MYTISHIINQFVQAKQAAHYSPNTIADYQHTYRRLLEWLDHDPEPGQVSPDDIRAFLAAMPVGPKTALNYHTGLSSLWQWMTDSGYVPINIIRAVERPRINQPEVRPYSRGQMDAILEAASHSTMAARDIAIVLLLLDTGIRASELCNLQMRDLSLPDRQVLVVSGKGKKGRLLYYSEPTRQALAAYIPSGRRLPTLPVIATDTGRAMSRDTLRLMLGRLGDRAGVYGVGCHRFRHTFAIEFLRNGGNIYALQRALGHSTLDMCKRYLMFVQADIQLSMTTASPVVKWGLGK
jgi:integrase/recombinase XerD